MPSSPGAKERVEQKPSVEDMSSVRPSLDLGPVLATNQKSHIVSTYQVRSENVAKCRLLTTHNGVVCCVSYTNTASWVATAYIIRYGSAKAEAGPLSSSGAGDDVGLEPSTLCEVWCASCGGSMKVEGCSVFRVGTTDSGNNGISSPAEAVSIVI